MGPDEWGPDDAASTEAADESVSSDAATDRRPTSDEAIRAAFCSKKGSECRSHSEVSVVTSIEDDSRLLAASVASLLRLYATRSREEGRQPVTPWDSPFIPKFSVHDFLDALLQNFHLSSESCAVAFIYIDRFMRLHPKFAVTFTNVHRLLLTSIVVAAKFFEDVRYSNSVFASFFGLSAKQMAGMELYFVRGLNWALYVSQEECDECQSLMLQWGEQLPERAEADVPAGRRPRKSASRVRAPRPRRTIRRC